MHPIFNHVPINQSFAFKCKCCFHFCALTPVLTSLTPHAISIYFQKKKICYSETKLSAIEVYLNYIKYT